MNREQRYTVLKVSDIKDALSANDCDSLIAIEERIAAWREVNGKQPLECVVVEHDWPEYELTWAAIEKRVDAAQGETAGDELIIRTGNTQLCSGCMRVPSERQCLDEAVNGDGRVLTSGFTRNTKTTTLDGGRVMIECCKGCWAVDAATEDEARREAYHYYAQYEQDGEYDDTGPKWTAHHPRETAPTDGLCPDELTTGGRLG